METKKVDPRVCNIKVYVAGKSRELQEKLFELGCKWEDGTRDLDDLNCPFLYVDQEGVIKFGIFTSTFVQKSNTEVDVDSILSMTPDAHEEEMLSFSPYDHVLGRDKEDQEWEVDIFVHLGPEPYPYVCFRDSYNYCIPYDGNEHLAGKIK